MRKLIPIVLLTALATAPAHADSFADQKAEIIKNSKQETIPLGNNRFMMLNGTYAAYQYVYSIDMLKIEKGIPHYEPIFMEEYDPRTKTVVLSDGTAFPSLNYHFDKITGVLDYTAKEEPDSLPMEYKYQLKGDTFELKEILAQDTAGGPLKTVFKAADMPAEVKK